MVVIVGNYDEKKFQNRLKTDIDKKNDVKTLKWFSRFHEIFRKVLNFEILFLYSSLN